MKSKNSDELCEKSQNLLKEREGQKLERKVVSLNINS